MLNRGQPLRVKAGTVRLARQTGCLLIALRLAVYQTITLPGMLFGFCNQDTPLGVLECPQNSGGHKEITEIALGFLRPGILEDIVDEHIFVDITGVLDSTQHFDNSRFTETIARINDQYSGAGGVVARLDPLSSNPFDASDEFGQLLHPVQDFYSHTNWVDYDPDDVPLFENGLGPWIAPSPYGTIRRGGLDLIVVEGLEPPNPITGFAIRQTPSGVNRLVDVIGENQAVIGLGLVSDASDGSLAPPGARIPHGSQDASDDVTTISKDTSLRTNHQAAFDAAVRQTQHEWCRLLYLAEAEHGQAGAGLAMALMVAPSGSPHPPGSPCHTSRPGVLPVEVRVTGIRILDDMDFFGSGELNLSLVLYTRDFRRSARTEVNSISVASGDNLSGGRLPEPLNLDVDHYDDVVVTLQGWDDDNLTADQDGIFDTSDEILRGVTLDFSNKPFTAGIHRLSSPHLEVTLEIVAPQVAGFSAWIARQTSSGSDRSFSGDPEGDGLPNGLEYVLGAHPEIPDNHLGPGLVVAQSTEGYALSFPYRDEAAIDVAWVIKQSSDLGSFTEIYRLQDGIESFASNNVTARFDNPVNPSSITVVDSVPRGATSFYQLEVELLGRR